MAEDRENGLYWVKTRYNSFDWDDLKWTIAYWYSKNRLWSFENSGGVRISVELIGPQILPPKEEEKRREGHYWVKRRKDTEIEVAKYIHSHWFRTGSEEEFTGVDFYWIGPRLSPPEREWQIKEILK